MSTDSGSDTPVLLTVDSSNSVQPVPVPSNLQPPINEHQPGTLRHPMQTPHSTRDPRPPESEPMSEQEAQRLQLDLDVALDDYRDDLTDDQKTLKAVEIFLTCERQGRPRFDQYNGKHFDRAKDVLLRALRALIGTSNSLRLYFGGIMPSTYPNSLKALLIDRFVEAILVKYRNTGVAINVDNVTDEWLEEIMAGNLHLKGYYFTEKNRSDLEKHVSTARKCYDKPYMRQFSTLLINAKEMKGKEKYGTPFIMLCAPSGSGKSMFGLNFCESHPSLYWLHKNSEQPVYQPFISFSNAVNAAFEQDMADNMTYFSSSLHSASVSSVEHKFWDTPLQSVHFIVCMLRRLFDIKEADPSLTWLQAQSKIEVWDADKMSLFAGVSIIERLEKKSSIPLSVFIDECTLLGEDVEQDALLADKKRLQFTRSVLRALGIIPILTGNDARTSNICAHTQFGGSRGSRYIRCIVVNDLPPFNSKYFEMRCRTILGILESAPHVAITRLLAFLKSTRENENPWLIELALQYIEDLLRPNHTLPRRISDSLLASLSTQFIRHKDRTDAFTLGQIGYVMSHRMDKHERIHVNKLDGTFVDSHLAHLAGTSDVYGIPFITLILSCNEEYYYMHEYYDFVPRSCYSPFHLSPLTGLILFGVNMSEKMDNGEFLHTPLVGGDKAIRITSFDSVFRALPKNSKLTSGNEMGYENTGTRTEILYHMATVIASRANGLSPCTLYEFLTGFVNELDTNSDTLRRGTADDDNTSLFGPLTENPKVLIIKGQHNFDKRRVPLVAPMSAPGWPQSAVDLLDGESEEPVLYGVFQLSVENEPVDSIVYECTAAPIPTAVPPYFTEGERNSARALVEESVSCGHKRKASEADDAQSSSSEFDVDGTEGKKIYGFLGGSYTVSQSVLGSISIVGECKQLHDNLNASNILAITEKFDTIPKCSTFIILALSISDFNSEACYGLTTTLSDPETMKNLEMRTFVFMNKKGYFFWFLDHGEDDDTLELKPVPGQLDYIRSGEAETAFKDVFIIGCGTIWGDSILERVRCEWFVRKAEDPVSFRRKQESASADESDLSIERFEVDSTWLA